MDLKDIKDWILRNEILSFARSGGPGGQYVNTSDTKVILRLPIMSLPVSKYEKFHLAAALKNRINANGELIIHSSGTRSQAQNREKAEKLAAVLIIMGLKPRKKRRPTKPTKASNEHRIKSKKARSKRKQQRKEPLPQD